MAENYKELSKCDSLTIHWTEYGRNDEFELKQVWAFDKDQKEGYL
ncbi:MAG: hypothetical protein OEV42_12955 [Deltaproteobacteria bacterium]|nr:hypothetical protein [Deltaproteobacteria bacterium]